MARLIGNKWKSSYNGDLYNLPLMANDDDKRSDLTVQAANKSGTYNMKSELKSEYHRNLGNIRVSLLEGAPVFHWQFFERNPNKNISLWNDTIPLLKELGILRDDGRGLYSMKNVISSYQKVLDGNRCPIHRSINRTIEELRESFKILPKLDSQGNVYHYLQFN